MKRLKYILYFIKNAWFVLLYKLFKKVKSCNRFCGEKNITPIYGDNVLLDKLNSSEPFMAVRYGATELSCINNGEKIKLGFKKSFKKSVVYSMKNNAGFFPCEERYLNQYCELMSLVMSNVDILGISGAHMEDYFYQKQCKNAKVIQYFSFEPINKKWLQGLNNKKVLIVSPFKDEILMQLNKKEHLPIKELNATFEVVEAVQTIGDETCDYLNWFDALEKMKKEIQTKEFDVALIGAGAYGAPLCAFVKDMNKQAIQTGGATPLLFGIVGRRWEIREYVKSQMNEHWIKPNTKPKGYEKIEKGCYW